MRKHIQIRSLLLACAALGAGVGVSSRAAELTGAKQFHAEIQPILQEFCYDCHGDGANKGNVAFDGFKSDQALLADRELWWNALKYTRAGIMPPEKNPRPSPEQQQRLEQWIKSAVFGDVPNAPDPGRVTVRRLNRTEYRNTIRDLMGVDYDTSVEFPPDDTGYGFDNIGDVLTLPPMLLEKYLTAAKTIVEESVPVESKVAPEKVIPGNKFESAEGKPGGEHFHEALLLSYYQPATVAHKFKVKHDSDYRLVLDLTAVEKFVENAADSNKCRLVFKADGQELFRREYSREAGKSLKYELKRELAAGEHELAFELEPLTPGAPRVCSLAMRINAVTVRGPMDDKYLTRPKNYERFFTRDVPPTDRSGRRAYAREVLDAFAQKAYRRPVDKPTVERLAAIAEAAWKQPGKSFEAGVAQAMVAVLASPRFLFREESAEPLRPGEVHPFVDEYALASRLSYFLWSSMPDEELFALAAKRQLKTNLAAQVRRMLADGRSAAFIRNFTGQWLQARDIDYVPIDGRSVLARENKFDPSIDEIRERIQALKTKPDGTLTAAETNELADLRARLAKNRARAELSGELRYYMRRETEMYFEHVVRDDRPVLELIDSDYTYLNEKLARHYGVPDVTGDDLRLVKLPADSPRGGILTQGTVLAVTSNPTRTSPVKRGLFVLENILGTPPPPPPPNVPPLEDASKGVKGHTPSLRETLAMHRANPLCNSCHSRMDPLGLAFENFNAMGMWRDQEYNQPLDVSGKFVTGETFRSIQDVKHILAQKHQADFYRCLAEKLLTYALGRGLEYYDVQTVDQIVDRLERENGRFSAVLMGVVESAPFQKRRNENMTVAPKAPPPPGQRAALN